jgi:hypothetical protein
MCHCSRRKIPGRPFLFASFDPSRLRVKIPWLQATRDFVQLCASYYFFPSNAYKFTPVPTYKTPFAAIGVE